MMTLPRYSLRLLVSTLTVAAIVAALVGRVGIETAVRSLWPATSSAVVVWLILAVNSETWARVRLIPVVLITLAFAGLAGITAVETQAIEPRMMRMANTLRKFHCKETETYNSFVLVGTVYGLSIGVVGSWCIHGLKVRRYRRREGIERKFERPK